MKSTTKNTTAELETYSMTDQPPTCPKCGRRVVILSGAEGSKQIVQCPGKSCAFKFRLEADDDDEAPAPRTTREPNTRTAAVCCPAFNAACITKEIYSMDSESDLNLADLENVAAAAFRLSSIEKTPGFSWETAGNDWETVCNKIATHLMQRGLPDALTIIAMIRSESFKVEHLYTYGWDDADWTENDAPLRFATREAAEAAIAELRADYDEAIKAGHMPPESAPGEYRVVKA